MRTRVAVAVVQMAVSASIQPACATANPCQRVMSLRTILLSYPIRSTIQARETAAARGVGTGPCGSSWARAAVGGGPLC